MKDPITEPFLILSDDGFSQFAEHDPAQYSIEQFIEHNVGYLRDYPGVKIKAFGVGPGSVFTYNTQVGDVFMQDVPPLAHQICRPCDRHARDMVKLLNESGKDSLTRVAEKCREMGIIPWARFQMNHEYGPTNEDNFTYACFVGRFNKEHPEYRIPKADGTPAVYPFLDYKHQEVRDFKLAIIREVVAHDLDGMLLDFCVYPPFFADPKVDGHYMTDFIRDVRRVLDEEGAKLGHKIDLAVRVEPDAEERLYMDWRTWVKEGWLDWIAPYYRALGEAFGAPVEPFLLACAGTNCRVITYSPTENVGRINRDRSPYDIRSGIEARTDRPFQHARHYARVFAGIKAGAPAILFATSSGAMYHPNMGGWRDMLPVLADFEFLKRAEKEYAFDYLDVLPAMLSGADNPFTHSVLIGDEVEDIESVTLVLYARGLTALESVTLAINGHEISLTEKELHWSPQDVPILPTKGSRGIITKYNPLHLARIDHWWDICRNEIDVPPAYMVSGRNTITLTYHGPDGAPAPYPLEVGELAFIIRPKNGSACGE